jgi:hypothetical protein
MTGRNGKSSDGYVEMSREEGYAILDKQTKAYLGISAHELIERWNAGEYRDQAEDPRIARLAMLMPVAL